MPMSDNDLARAMATGWRHPDDLPMALREVLRAEETTKERTTNDEKHTRTGGETGREEPAAGRRTAAGP